MRLQLFKGSYAILLGLAMAGLFLMLTRQAGDGYALVAWLGLVVLGLAGLIATGSDHVALGGAVLGLLGSAYLRFNGTPAASSSASPGGVMRVNLTLGVYVILTLILSAIWAHRRKAA